MVEAGEDVDRFGAALTDERPRVLQLREIIRRARENLAARVRQVGREAVTVAIGVLGHFVLLSRAGGAVRAAAAFQLRTGSDWRDRTRRTPRRDFRRYP